MHSLLMRIKAMGPFPEHQDLAHKTEQLPTNDTLLEEEI